MQGNGFVMIGKLLLIPRLLAMWTLLFLALDAGHAANREKQETIQLVTDAETVDLLTDLGQPLVAAAGLPEGLVRFHVMLNSALNAFALPTGEIVLHSGLVLAAANRDELAAVMAHEIAHLAAGHHVQLKSESRTLALQTLIAAMVGVAAGVVADDPEIAQAAILGGAAGGTSALLASVRQKETQADRLAVQLLARVGYDPEGLTAFMAKLEQSNRFASQPPPYLRSHPVSGERVAEARDMAERNRPATPRADRESSRLTRVRAKLTAAIATDASEAEARFQRQLTLAEDPIALRYGIALSRRYAGHLEAAEAELTALLKELPGDPYLLRERAMTHMEGNRAALAEADLREALTRRPKSVDLRYQLAFVLNEEDELPEASRILYRLTTEEPREAKAFHLLGLVEGKRKLMGWSHLALARSYRLTGEKGSARWHYREAEKSLPTGSPEQLAAAREGARLDKKEDEEEDRP